MAEDPEEEEEDEDWNTSLKLVEEYDRRHRVKQYFQRFIEFALFIGTLDPLSIYKASTYSNRSAKRFEIYQSQPLRIELTRLDKWRKLWNFTFRLAVTYFCLKFSAILLVQVALYSRHQSLTGSQLAECNDPLGVLARILGNPLIALPGLTIFLSALIVIILVYTVLYMSLDYTIEPMNCVELRLWLDPEREFRRIDISILKTLDMFSQPLESSCHCKRGRKRRKYATIKYDHELSTNREIQTQVISLFRSRYWYLRPAIYTPQWYKAFNKFIIKISIPINVSILLFASYAARPLIKFLFTSTTLGELDWARLSLYQTITTIEFLISLLFLSMMAIFQILIFTSLCYSQSILLDDVEVLLKACLAELKHMNRCPYGAVDPMTPISTMLRPLIRISHSLEELRSNMRFLTEMVSINVVMSGTACVLILLAGHVDGDNLADFRWVAIGFHWLWANLIFTSCAYIYTRATKLETITWSMMAELRSRELRDDWLMFEFQVAGSWRRLILSRCFSNPEMSVRPFGITLTYDRALKFNYLAVSFASLLKSF